MLRRAILVLALAVMLPFAVSAGGGFAPRWTVRIDSRTADQWLSESAGAVYGARDGRLVAIDLRNGRTRWTARVPVIGRSAAHHGFVAAPTADSVAFVDARSGRTVVTRRVGNGPGVASSSAGFVAVVSQAPDLTVARGFSFGGVPLWTKRYRFGADPKRIMPLGGNAVGLRARSRILVIDARDGHQLAQTNGVDDVIGADGRYLWFNVIGGGIKGLDLDTNRARAVHGSIVKGAARVEHGVAVAVVDGRLQKIDLTRGEGDATAAVALHVDGRWVGGPTAGHIFLERSDGMYVRTLDGRTRARRVARYKGESRIVAADGRMAMIGMENGVIYVVDVRRETQLAQIDTSCRAYEGFAGSGDTTIVHCDDARHVSQLVAFGRYPRLVRARYADARSLSRSRIAGAG